MREKNETRNRKNNDSQTHNTQHTMNTHRGKIRKFIRKSVYTVTLTATAIIIALLLTGFIYNTAFTPPAPAPDGNAAPTPGEFNKTIQPREPVEYKYERREDTDKDGIYDYQEENGLFNDSERDQQDIYIELDYMQGAKPDPEELEKVKELYANAPIENPNGDTGINLHINVGQEIPAQEATSTDAQVRQLAEQHSDYYKQGYIYAVKAPIEKAGETENGIITGRAYTPSAGGSGVFVYTNPGIHSSAKTFAHELGHILMLSGDGVDSRKYSLEKYNSVMNYNSNGEGIEVGYSTDAPFNEWEQISNSL